MAPRLRAGTRAPGGHPAVRACRWRPTRSRCRLRRARHLGAAPAERCRACDAFGHLACALRGCARAAARTRRQGAPSEPRGIPVEPECRRGKHHGRRPRDGPALRNGSDSARRSRRHPGRGLQLGRTHAGLLGLHRRDPAVGHAGPRTARRAHRCPRATDLGARHQSRRADPCVGQSRRDGEALGRAIPRTRR